MTMNRGRPLFSGTGILLIAAACGTNAADDDGKKNNNAGSPPATGGTTATGGSGGTTSGSAGQATTGGSAGTASPTGGSAGVGGSVGGTGPAGGGTGPAGGGTGPAGGSAGSTGAAGGATGAGGTGPAGGSAGMAGSGPMGGAGGGGGDPTVLTVQLDQVRQIIRGFGINATITDGKALPWSKLFSVDGTDGLGLSILRIGMNENGGHRDVASGWDTVKSMGARVIGSCWSAPASWKTNNNVNGGGHLKPDYYDDWAKMIAKYAKDNGLYAMSIGNETDFASCDAAQSRPCNPPLTTAYPSMVYTGKELAAFAKVAGPIFKSDAPGVKMITPEASLWIHVWSNLSPTSKGVSGAPGGGYNSSDPLGCGCFSNTIDATVAATCKCADGDGYNYGHWLAKDPDAWSAFDIMGVHEYESQIAYQWPSDVTSGVRDKEVWQTEMSGVLHWPEQGPSKDINNGVAVARWIHSALTVGEASAWLYWWYKDYYNGDNEGLALLMSDSDSATPAKRYYTMGNFSRFIRPDMFHAVRVAGPAPSKVLVSAYKADDGKLVIVAINETSAAADVPIAISGGTAPAMMVPYVTSADANWKAGTAVAVASNSLPASLPAMSVTTFVSQ